MNYIEGLMDYTMDRDTAVTLGKFDGLHLGHQKLIRRVCERDGLAGTVVTIWPDPKQKALLTKTEKKALLASFGVQWWVDCPFLPQIAHMEPEEFVRKILAERLRAKYIAVGADFRFGYQRKGDCSLLAALQKELGYELEIVPKERFRDREISSSYIREALEQGDMELVNRLLGYPYTVQGEVLHGRKIGRTLGMPTTNLIPSAGKLLPPNGVYATRTVLPHAYGQPDAGTHADAYSQPDVGIHADAYSHPDAGIHTNAHGRPDVRSQREGRSAPAQKRVLPGITNVGYKPTVGEYFRGVETYLFDYDGDLYGQEIAVQFYAFERPEKKFGSMEELKAQMHRDIAFGKRYFS